MNARNWIDIEPGNHSLSACEVSKQVIHLLPSFSTSTTRRGRSGSFLESKELLQNQFSQSIYWSDNRWKVCLSGAGGAKRRLQYCTDDSGIIICFRALQGHSGRNLINLSLQDNLTIQSGFFHHMYHIGCAFNLQSSTMD